MCLDLAKGLAQRGHSISLLYDQPGSMLNVYEAFCSETSQVDLQAFGWRTLFQSVICARKIRRTLKSLETEAVICSELHYIRMLTLSTLGTGIKVLFHLGLPAAAPMLSKRWAYRFIDYGVCPSEHTRASWIKDRWPKGKLHVIPNWVDSARFKPAQCKTSLRDQLKLPCNKKILAYVGRLVPEKGIQTLLEAFSALCRRGDNVLLALIGRAPLEGTCDWKEMAHKLGIAQHCLFVGQSDLPEKYMAAADLVVVPSEWEEPFGLTVVESMSCCVIPVVSSVGILAELIGPDAGQFTFQAGNSVQLLSVITELLDLPEVERRRIGVGLRERAQARFSSESCVQAYERLIIEN